MERRKGTLYGYVSWLISAFGWGRWPSNASFGKGTWSLGKFLDFLHRSVSNNFINVYRICGFFMINKLKWGESPLLGWGIVATHQFYWFCQPGRKIRRVEVLYLAELCNCTHPWLAMHVPDT